MIFNSIAFLVFFVVVTTAYYVLPYRWRWPLLLAASCYFYMAFVPVYILILAFTIVVDYAAGHLIERSQGATRKRWLIASIVANVGVLAIFKYYGFLTENIEALVHGTGWTDYKIPELGIILPIGLSFHTFQSLSYTIEVYYGRQKAERHIGIFSLYVMFYPQLVAGPIERPGNLLRQLHLSFDFHAPTVASGLRLMAWGFFKKLMIADRVAVMVDHVFNSPEQHSGPAMILASFFFAVQIYCDFSGYSDIALGAARCLGIDLMRNFRTPYYSANVSEFWKRWHISLSSWFRDYVYIPLGGNRVVKWRWYYNLMITFLLSGLMARRGVDLHHLGRLARLLFDLRHRERALAREAGRAAGAWSRAGDQPRRSGPHHVRARGLRLDLLPGEQRAGCIPHRGQPLHRPWWVLHHGCTHLLVAAPGCWQG
jgi:alginate O-acetyltransferase complex protein AlgI